MYDITKHYVCTCIHQETLVQPKNKKKKQKSLSVPKLEKCLNTINYADIIEKYLIVNHYF